MSQKEENTILQLVKLIMSSKSVDEKLQRETLQCLNSNPAVLLSVLKKSYAGDDDKSSQNSSEGCNQSVHEKASNKPTNDCLQRDKYDKEEKTVNKADIFNAVENTGQERTELNSNEQTNDDTVIENSNETFEVAATPADTDGAESKPKKRKSKYSYIQGDLSHIQRDPKCGKRDLQKSHQRSKRKKVREKDKKYTEKQREVSEAEENIQLARKMIHMLKNPKSMQRQECILSLLREDEDLRKLFMKEKAKMGRQIVHVYRRSASRDESNHLRKGSDNQTASSSNQNGRENQHELYSSGFSSPCSIASESDVGNLDDSGTDALINSLISSLGANGADMCHDPESEPQSDDLRLLVQLKSFSPNGSYLQQLQEDCSQSSDVLYTETTQTGGLPGTSCGESSALLFNTEETQTLSRTPPAATSLPGQQPSSSTGFAILADEQASTSNRLRQIATENYIQINDQELEACSENHMQELSQELYHTNNVRPNDC